MSDSLQPHGLYSPWNSPGQNTGVGSLSLLQGIFPTQKSNRGLLPCRWILYQLSYQESHNKNLRRCGKQSKKCLGIELGSMSVVNSALFPEISGVGEGGENVEKFEGFRELEIHCLKM